MRFLLICLSLVCLSLPLQAQSSYRDRTPVERYLLSALDFISTQSYYRDRIDWDTHYDDMLARLQDVEPDNLEAAYPLIRETLDLLDDSHSFFATAAQYDNNFSSSQRAIGLRITADDVVYLVYPNSPAAEAGIAAGDTLLEVSDASEDEPQQTLTLRRPTGETYTTTAEPERFPVMPWQMDIAYSFDECVAYIESHHISSEDFADDYVTTMWEAIERIQAERDVCGWIVDVRRNMGGRVHPILMGIAPLAGEGAYFQEAYPTVRNTWTYQDGALYYDGSIEWNGPARLDEPDVDTSVPLVVLMGQQTASAGETAIMALRERDNTYLIGETTYGATTRVNLRELRDGARVSVSSARLADPDGNLYGLRLEPDEVVPVQWDVFATENDPAIQAALNWIATAQTDEAHR